MTDEERAAVSYWNSSSSGAFSSEKNYKMGYLDGLKEGRKEKWHDLRKDTTDRPIQDCDVALKVYNHKTKEIISDIGFFKIKQDMFFHYKSACRIIAWCELPKFEE